MLVCLRIFVVLDVSENQRPNAGQLIQRSGVEFSCLHQCVRSTIVGTIVCIYVFDCIGVDTFEQTVACMRL